MVKLFCAIVGEAGSAFSVIVDESKGSVDDVKKAIAKYQKYDFAASKMHLFLAKTAGNKWLESDSEDVKKLKKGEKTAAVEALTCEEEELQGEYPISDFLEVMDPPKAKQIHVLVVVPEGTGGSVGEAPALAQILAQLGAMQRQMTDSQPAHSRKRKFAHSKVGSTNGVELLDALRIQVKNVHTVPFAATEVSSVDPYVWKTVIVNGVKVELTEEQQRKQYLEYVERNIGDVLNKQQLSVIGVEKGENILTVNVPGHKIKLTGRTDLLILSDIVKKFPSETWYLPEVKMLIEVKKDVIQSNDFQAMSELIALDLLVDHPVMALLTDLKENWVFFWVDKETNNSTCIRKAAVAEPGVAFDVIKALLAQPLTAGTATTTEFTLPCFEVPVKRLKLKEALPTLGEGGGDIRDSIERYYDIASMLGPDLEMARAVAYQVTRSIPTLSNFS